MISLAQLYGHLSRENSTLRGFSLVSRLSALRNCRRWSRPTSRGWWLGSAQPRGNTRGPKGASIRPTLHAERFIMCELTMRAGLVVTRCSERRGFLNRRAVAAKSMPHGPSSNEYIGRQGPGAAARPRLPKSGLRDLGEGKR